MSLPVRAIESGRLDQLLLALAELGVRRYVEPHLRVPIWNPGLSNFVQRRITSLGVPAFPVQSVQLGQIRVPLAFFEAWARAAKLLPPVLTLMQEVLPVHKILPRGKILSKWERRAPGVGGGR